MQCVGRNICTAGAPLRGVPKTFQNEFLLESKSRMQGTGVPKDT